MRVALLIGRQKSNIVFLNRREKSMNGILIIYCWKVPRFSTKIADQIGTMEAIAVACINSVSHQRQVPVTLADQIRVSQPTFAYYICRIVADGRCCDNWG